MVVFFAYDFHRKALRNTILIVSIPVRTSVSKITSGVFRNFDQKYMTAKACLHPVRRNPEKSCVFRVRFSQKGIT